MQPQTASRLSKLLPRFHRAVKFRGIAFVNSEKGAEGEHPALCSSCSPVVVAVVSRGTGRCHNCRVFC